MSPEEASLAGSTDNGGVATVEREDNNDQVEQAMATGKWFDVHIRIVGVARLMFHRWNGELIEWLQTLPRGHEAKKVDYPDSYVFLDEKNRICLPGEYFVASLIAAGARLNDPSSGGKKKSAKDLFKGAIIPHPDYELCPITSGVTGKVAVWKKNPKAPRDVQFTPLFGTGWDYVDMRGVKISHTSRVNRKRPAFWPGWQCDVGIRIVAPEFVSPEMVRQAVDLSAMLYAVAEKRPQFGRFQVNKFEIIRPK